MTAVFFLSGCDAVLTETPITLEMEPGLGKELVGKWKSEDSILEVTFSGGENAEVSWMDQDEKKRADLRGLRKGDWIYFSFLPKDDEDLLFWFFCACKLKTKEELILFLPRSDEFQKLVTEGKIKGVIEKGKYSATVKVEEGPALLQLIAENPDKYLEEAEDPITRVP